MPRTSRGLSSRPRFATRLLIAQGLVLVAGAFTIWLVASIVAPSLFHDHLERAGDTHTVAETQHIEEAFASALLVSISVASMAAVAAALAVSWYFSRRVQRSIDTVAQAAADVAAGRYGTRVPDPGLGGEFTALSSTYNTLAQRLETTEQTRRRMLADLAHEMRTPLATLEAHLEAVEDGVRTFDPSTRHVFWSSMRRLQKLAEDMSAVSKAEEGQLALTPTPVPVADLVNAAADAARGRYAAEGVQLVAAASDCGRVLVDPDRMGQVLSNMVDNALRHTDAGGTVTLGCRRIDAKWVEVTVSDDGQGIAADHLSHIFDRFYRADSARDRDKGGSGIGLAIARALVEAHGGGISASSPGPGRGATFTVRLPALAT